MIEAILNFVEGLTELLTNMNKVMNDTTKMLDDVQFSGNVIENYLGYARFAMGDLLWFMFWTVCSIPVGVFLFNFSIRAYTFVKNLVI